MDPQSLKRFTDAAFMAKHFTELMPALPNGISSRMLRCADAIRTLGRDGTLVRPTDVSRHLGVALPGVTVTIGELVERGLARKEPSPTDARAQHVSLTEAGERLLTEEIDAIFGSLAARLDDVSEEEVSCTIRVIERAYRALAAYRTDQDARRRI